MSQFDVVLPRKGTDCIKWDYMDKWLNVDADNCLPSWVSDSDFVSPDFLITALNKRLEHPNFGYTERSKEYFDATISWFDSHHQVKLNPESFLTTPGTLPAIAALIEEVTIPNDRVLMFGPAYTCFYRTVEYANRVPYSVPLINTNGYYIIDFEGFERALKSGVSAMIFCNPHNPVGRCWSPEEVSEVVRLCHTYGVYLISDEIWADLTFFGHKYTSCLTLKESWLERTAVCLSAAKTFNIPSFRLANTIIPNPKLAAVMRKKLLAYGIDVYSALSLVANTVCYQKGDLWLDEMKNYLEDNIQFTCNFIESDIPVMSFFRPEASYLAWIDCRGLGLNDEQLKQRFYHGAKVIPSMGETFGENGTGFIRLNLSCPKSMIEQKLERIKREFNPNI